MVGLQHMPGLQQWEQLQVLLVGYGPYGGAGMLGGSVGAVLRAADWS